MTAHCLWICTAHIYNQKPTQHNVYINLVSLSCMYKYITEMHLVKRFQHPEMKMNSKSLQFHYISPFICTCETKNKEQNVWTLNKSNCNNIMECRQLNTMDQMDIRMRLGRQTNNLETMRTKYPLCYCL